MKCKFCDKNMISGHFYWDEYISVCKNHDVFYAENEKFSIFGKDGYEIHINKNGEVCFSIFEARSIRVTESTYFNGYVYGLPAYSKKLIVNTKDIDVDIYTFDKIVNKLKKLVPFS